MPAIKEVDGHFIIPLNLRVPTYKVEVDDYDVSEYFKGGTIGVGSNAIFDAATIMLTNKDGILTREFEQNNIMKVYADFDNATNQIFEGRVDEPIYIMNSDVGFALNLSARGYSADASIKVNELYESGITISDCFKELRDEYLPHHSSDNTNIADIDIIVYPTWSERPLINCFEDLMLWADSNYFFYCDFNKIWHVFEKGTRTCDTEAAIYGDNIKRCEFGDGDFSIKRNRVTVYGQELEGIPLLYTADDEDIQSTDGFIKDEIISNNNLLTSSTVKDHAIAQLAKLKTLEQHGTASCLGMPTLRPGYRLLTLNSYCNVSDYRNVVEVTHNIGRGFYTDITLAEKEKGILSTFEDRIRKEQEQIAIRNRYNMKYAHVIDFEGDDTSELETKYQTTVWNNNLMLALLQTSGYAITKIHVAPKNVSYCVLKCTGQSLTSDADEYFVTYKISVDGVSWESLKRDELHEVQGTGKNIRIRVDFISLTSKIRALGLLYK